LLSPGNIHIDVQVDKFYAGKAVHLSQSTLEMTREGNFDFVIKTQDAKIRMICRNDQD
jgi:hypothetical protein